MEPDETQRDEDDGGVVEVRFTTIHSMRLKMFSDAVWSIIATLMIVPTMHATEEIRKTALQVPKLLHEILPQILLYFLAFQIICSTWTCHVWTFQTMNKVTDLSVFFNLAILLAGSFLPYFYSLMSRFQTWPTIVIYSSIQIAIGVIMIVIVWHSFSYPGVLSAKIHNKSERQKRAIRRKIFGHLLVVPVFCILAICLSFISPTAAIVCLSLILLYPWIQSVIVCLISRIPASSRIIGKKQKQMERDILLTERVKKERIEAFSDGVFAITSTLLVLDITERYLPKKSEVKASFDGQVTYALAMRWGVFISYVLTFMIIGLFWYTHLTLFKNLEKFSRFMLLANNLGLSCVGLIPFSFSLVLSFNDITAVTLGIQFGCVALFLLSLFNAVLYVLGILFGRCNKDEAWVSADIKVGGKDFGLLILQLVWAPASSIIVFCLTFTTNGLTAAYVGAGLVVLYAIILVLWKTIKATLFERLVPPLQRGEYSRMRSTEEIDEAHDNGDE